MAPCWAAALVATPLPAWRLGTLLRRRRRLRRAARAGLCRACLYDLTANQSGVCPECGTPTAAAAAAAARKVRP